MLLEPLPRLLDETVHVLDGHGQVVLVDLAKLARSLGERLAEGPEGEDLGLVLGENSVGDDLRLEQVLQQCTEFLHVTTSASASRGRERRAHLIIVVLVASARLEQDVERPPVRRRSLERGLLSSMRKHHVQSLLVEELERRQDLSECDASLLEDPLDALEVGNTQDGHIDSLKIRSALNGGRDAVHVHWGVEA
jgi:hypothetical protein